MGLVINAKSMTTVINNPGSSADRSDSAASLVNMIIGIILLIVVAAGLFFVYALPLIRTGNTSPQNSSIDVSVKLPVEKTPKVLTPAAVTTSEAPAY